MNWKAAGIATAMIVGVVAAALLILLLVLAIVSFFGPMVAAVVFLSAEAVLLWLMVYRAVND